MNKGESPNCKPTLLVDWFQFTLLDIKSNDLMPRFGGNTQFGSFDNMIPYLFKELFNVHMSDIVKENSRLNGYDRKYSYRGIEMYLNTTREDMGINVKLSGSACRDFEELGLDWIELIKKISKYECNYNRIDIAIDCYDDKYFDLEKLKSYIVSGLVVSKFKNTLELCKRDLKSGSITGNTLQFGSKASQVEITFYDKLLERQSQNYIVENSITFWTRTELRFRHERAFEIAQLLLNKEDERDLALHIKAILLHYIEFKTKKSDVSRVYNRPTAQFWSDFTENVESLKLATITPERSITRKKAWLLRSTSKSLAQVLLSELDVIGKDNLVLSNFIDKMLEKGFKDLTDKDLELVNNNSKYKFDRTDINALYDSCLELLHSKTINMDPNLDEMEKMII